MMYENKFWIRENNHFRTDKMEKDLSGLRYLHIGVDTLKYLFQCSIRPSVLTSIQKHYDLQLGNIINLEGTDFIISKSSKTSGYQYILKNLDLGFVVLLKSFYVEPEDVGSHLKIEVSPEVIDRSTAWGLDTQVENIAKIFGAQIQPVGIAAHIALDFKGVEIPQDFEARLVTRSRRNFRYNTINKVEFSLPETAVIYGQGQSYTFGQANTLQMCLYDKTAQAEKLDKLTFWQSVWGRTASVDNFPASEYQPGDKVHRLEFRFHHSVINEFVNGSVMADKHGLVKDDDGNNIHISIRSFSDLVPHLTYLFRYGLNQFRLIHSSTYIDPLWQAFLEDVEVYSPSPNFFYKREKKKPSGSSRRNVACWLGNVLRLYTRLGFEVDYVSNYILQSGLHSDLADYFCLPGPDRDLLYAVVYDFVREKMNLLSLEGVAA